MISREFCDFSIDDDVMPSPAEVLRQVCSFPFDNDDPEIDPYVHLHENFIMKLAAYIEAYYGD